ncbi:hypothetical protein IJI31_03310 [bacterium]|nr:hypothetical protein [bacterium]
MRIQSTQNILFSGVSRSRNYENAMLMLHGQNDIEEFKRSHDLTVKADSIDTNPITALGYKFYKTVKYIFNNNKPENNKLSIQA